MSFSQSDLIHKDMNMCVLVINASDNAAPEEGKHMRQTCMAWRARWTSGPRSDNRELILNKVEKAASALLIVLSHVHLRLQETKSGCDRSGGRLP